jgi:hypothetical protein
MGLFNMSKDSNSSVGNISQGQAKALANQIYASAKENKLDEFFQDQNLFNLKQSYQDSEDSYDKYIHNIVENYTNIRPLSKL